MLVTWLHILGIPPILSVVMESTVLKLAFIYWLCFAVGFIFCNAFIDLLSLDSYHDRVFLVFSLEFCGYWCV